MTDRPPPSAAECDEFHCRLMKCALEVDHSRDYWRNIASTEEPVTPRRAFTEYWFGARSLARVEMLLAHMRWRFDNFPAALRVLANWRDMEFETRRLICHWHLQLSDPLYRAFTGQYLVDRRASGRTDVSRDPVFAWVDQQAPGRWTVPTRLKFATKLLHAAHSAGLLASPRDPRPLSLPRVPDEALTYLLYLLREVRFQGTLVHNPYLASVGLEEDELNRRLRGLAALNFQRQGDVLDFGWRYSNLTDWAENTVLRVDRATAGAAS